MNRESTLLNSIYGETTHPYYIYTPRWINSSAGIKALHFLCHSLNQKGQKAFLVFSEPEFRGQPRINPNLHTPILDLETARAHFNAGICPVVLYSETVPGNPLGGGAVVRYLMNFPGALGGPKSFLDSEMLIAFSSTIAKSATEESAEHECPVLFIPPIDPRDFVFTTEKENYQIVYAGKYRSFIGAPPKIGDLKSSEIFRDGPRMQSRKNVIKLIQKADVVYSFENSSIVTEAILSGTPACFVPNQFLNEVIAKEELGDYGMAKTPAREDIEEARKTVGLGRELYFKRISEFSEDLSLFIKDTQFFAFSNGYEEMIQLPYFNEGAVVTTHRKSLARQILKNNGLVGLLRVTYRFVMRRLAFRFWLKDS
jgi:hypothetical protein